MSNGLLSRRATMATLTGAGFFIPAWNETVEAADAITCVASTPAVTEGPYWVDEKLFRSDIRADPSTGIAREGVKLTLTINVQSLSGSSCTPLAGAYVDIWHCDAKGIYSDESTYNPGGGTGNVNTSGQKFLRGYQITDGNGAVTFTTVYPGWYTSRTIHIHVRVRTYSGTTVLSNFVSQIFFDETINNTVLAQSSYSRTGARDTTNTSDNVYNVANNTRMLATASGGVTDGYSASITLGGTFQAPSAAAPVITAGGIANAASGSSGLTPGAWISIYGTDLSATARALASTDLVNNTIPTALAGVSVKINNKAAFVQYVSATQINVLAPSDTSRGSVAVTVTNAAGTSNSVTATLAEVLPGLAVSANGYVRAVRYPDGAIINGTGAAEIGYVTSASIAPGETLALFGTGYGPTNSSLSDGLVFTGSYPTTNKVTVTIGNTAADVQFAGLVGAGLYQINVTIPATLADGDHAVVTSVLGVLSPSTAKVKVLTGTKASLSRRQLFARRKAGLPATFSVEQIAARLFGD